MNGDERAIKIGLDLGNRSLKVCSDKNSPHKYPVAYRVISQSDYENMSEEEIGSSTTFKVKYKNKYYLVGDQCEQGLAAKNKGAKRYREVANMFKLIGLALDMRAKNMVQGDFYVVTGTPVEDFDIYKEDYRDLMLTDGSGYETIEINHTEYNIRVKDVVIAKQSASVAPTFPEWKKVDLLIFDFGGGTLDISYFTQGVRQKYFTKDNFSLNEILKDLGLELNLKGLGLPRPDSGDGRFMSLMESVVMNGRYKDETTISIEGKNVELKNYCADYLQHRVDDLINDITGRLMMSDADCRATEVYYIGGGAKLLFDQLNTNTVFEKITVPADPVYANVITYLRMADVKGEWK